jgi:hypothetical protein
MVTKNNYDSLTELHTPKVTVTTAHMISYQFAVSSASLPDDGFQQCPLLPCARSYRLTIVSQLTHCFNCPVYNLSARPHRKHRSSVAVSSYYRANMLVCEASLTAVLLLLISRSLPSSGSTCHDIKVFIT